MVFDLLIGTFSGGLGLLLSVLHLMRALYACGICEDPDHEDDLPPDYW